MPNELPPILDSTGGVVPEPTPAANVSAILKMKITPPSMDKLLNWATEAATVFLNGVLSGIGGGTLVGAGTGAVTVTAAGSVTPNSLSTALLAASLSAAGNGVKRVVVWHDSHPIPNPFVLDQQSSATTPESK